MKRTLFCSVVILNRSFDADLKCSPGGLITSHRCVPFSKFSVPSLSFSALAHPGPFSNGGIGHGGGPHRDATPRPSSENQGRAKCCFRLCCRGRALDEAIERPPSVLLSMTERLSSKWPPSLFAPAGKYRIFITGINTDL